MVGLVKNNKVAVLLHHGLRDLSGKTGLAFLRYGEAEIVAVIDRQCVGESLSALTKLPQNAPIVASVTDALAYHPNVLIIGVAPSGGALPEDWKEDIKEGIRAGLSVANGLHTPMAWMKEELPGKTLKSGQWIWDIRQEPPGLKIGSGLARSLPCQRILTVGTDMAIGKMSTALELRQEAIKRGIKTKFVATGQGGLMIIGEGIPLDAIRVDFAAGAVEKAVLEIGQDCELLLVEGQGSLVHPGSTATLPLLRGSQPTGLILVHRAQQTHLRTCPDVPIPPLPEVIKVYESVATMGGAFAETKVLGIALNTFSLGEEAAREEVIKVSEMTGLPCTDVVRFGAKVLLEAILNVDKILRKGEKTK